MQYRFTLPADYDMDVIDIRIQEYGAKLDGFPCLLFKAYLVSYKNEAYCNENRYAPLYLWKNAEAMANFLQSPGFKKLTQDFGWPQIDTWLALRLPDMDEVRSMVVDEKATNCRAQCSFGLPQEGQLCAWDVSRWQLLQVDFGSASGAGQENYRIK